MPKSRPNIPDIRTEDASSPSVDVDQHPANPAFLSPYNAKTPNHNRANSGSSTAGSDGGSSSAVPPSPTLSAHSESEHATSTKLRDNRPEFSDGTSSLNMLGPGDPGYQPSRHESMISLASEDGYDTEADQSSLAPLNRTISNASGASTRVGYSSDAGKGKSKERKPKKGKKRGEEPQSDAPTQPSPSNDNDVDLGPFSFQPHQLAGLVDPKNLEALEKMGGQTGLLKGLGTNGSKGLQKQSYSTRDGKSQTQQQESENNSENVPDIVVISEDGDQSPEEGQQDEPNGDKDSFSATLEDRQRVYGRNILPARQSNTLLQLMWAALKDKVLVLLSVAAVVSLALGFFQDFGPGRDPNKPPVDWVEGVAIIVAIAIVVMVGSINDWQKESQFRKLNEKKEERGLKVIRNGDEKVIDVKQVVVGDVALLEPGEIIPCDGIFLSGHNVKCDESGATGESDAIRKVSYQECLELREKEGDEESHTDCFLISGSRVQEGYGRYVVIAVGPKSFNGRILMALRGDSEDTPLQKKLNDLAEMIARVGSAAGLILFTALMIRFFVQLGTGNPTRTPNQNGIAFVNILIISVTLVVVAVPEGLPLAVTLALAFATRRMTAENLLVRVLGSCETMANASVVCTDKTGTLTQNVMSVVAGSIGIHGKFVRNLEDNKSRTNAPDENPEETDREIEDVDQAGTSNKEAFARKHKDDFTFEQSELDNILPEPLKKLMNDAIAINSTAFEDTDSETGEKKFVGSKTETALLSFAKESGWNDYKKTRENAEIVEMIPFSSDRKAMGVVVKVEEGKWRLFLKGASEILTRSCSSHVVVHKPDSPSSSEGKEEIETDELDDVDKDNISRTIIFYANQSLRTIALCYRDFESWPPQETELTQEKEVSYDDLCQDLTLICITGIEDPLREGVADAVEACHKAGVTVKMCTGDNVLTARSIASQCGIYSAGGIIMEGPVFRKLDEKDRLEVVPRLQVLARSSPEDKKVLVETLKALGETVGVTGDGTNDGPALKTANVGFSMGIAGTEVAKEASDIILMDDNFASIVKAIMWGRCVNDAVRKFLQFQISTNITAVIITFVSAVASVEEESVLSAVQLLWINIIMDTFAALALATDPASPALLDRKPESLETPLFSAHMIKMIIGQSLYQVIVTLVFHFLGDKIMGLDQSKHSQEVLQTLVFNAFVFAQIFNSINCRGLDSNLNIFRGITKNWYFITITLIEIGGQILIVFLGGAAFQVTRIGAREWGVSLALGVVSLPLGVIIRLIPTTPCERLFIKMKLLPNPDVLPTKRNDDWNPAINRVRDNLWVYANVRGGRLAPSALQKRQDQKDKIKPDDHIHTSFLLAMVPTLVASSIGAGWSPNVQSGGLSDPAQIDPSKSSTELWDGKVQLHPHTKPDDPARKWMDKAKNSQGSS